MAAGQQDGVPGVGDTDHTLCTEVFLVVIVTVIVPLGPSLLLPLPFLRLLFRLVLDAIYLLEEVLHPIHLCGCGGGGGRVGVSEGVGGCGVGGG